MADMELPVLDRFCFVFHLKTGCIVLGVINSSMTFVLALFLITLAMDVKVAADAQAKREDAEAGMSNVIYTILLLLVVLLFLKFLFDLMFVWAVQKERLGLIKKYCIFWIIFLVLFIIGFLKTLSRMVASIIICLVLFLAANIYFICIIRSYMRSIREEGVL